MKIPFHIRAQMELCVYMDSKHETMTNQLLIAFDIFFIRLYQSFLTNYPTQSNLIQFSPVQSNPFQTTAHYPHRNPLFSSLIWPILSSAMRHKVVRSIVFSLIV